MEAIFLRGGRLRALYRRVGWVNNKCYAMNDTQQPQGLMQSRHSQKCMSANISESDGKKLR